MSVAVPAQYQGWVDQAASSTGLPPEVVAAQVNVESGFNPSATSPTGAEGIVQFEPGTWQSIGAQGSPYNPTDALPAYEKYMGELLAQFGGNVRDALAAYNAGPGNLQAGYGYADAILKAAGHGGGLQVTGGAPSGSGGSTASLGGISAALGQTPGLAALAVLGGGLVLLVLGLWAAGVSL